MNIRYVPEFQKRWNRISKEVNSFWRVDETYIKIAGRWNYLFRAFDKHGKTIDFLLRHARGTAAAQAFFRKALCTTGHHWPKKVTLDGHRPSHLALRYLRREDPKWIKVKVRSSQYLNKVVEQDLEAFYRDRSMLKRSVFPEDIAEATYFFCAEHLSAKSTGNILNVDAGNLAAFTR